MTSKERKKFIDYMALKEELEEEKRQGYLLALKGREASAGEIARACVFQEESSYMRDYITESPGRPVVISFHPVQR